MATHLPSRVATDVTEALPTMAGDMVAGIPQLHRTLARWADLKLDSPLAGVSHGIVVLLRTRNVGLAPVAHQLQLAGIFADGRLADHAVCSVAAVLLTDLESVQRSVVVRLHDLADERAAVAVDTFSWEDLLLSALLLVGTDKRGAIDEPVRTNVEKTVVDLGWVWILARDDTLDDRGKTGLADGGGVDDYAVHAGSDIIAANCTLNVRVHDGCGAPSEALRMLEVCRVDARPSGKIEERLASRQTGLCVSFRR